MSQQPPSDDTPRDDTPRGRPSSSGRSPAGSGKQHRSPSDASPYDHELSTDPGRPHPYESLYRGSPERGRPTPRHWEPNLNPPEAAVGDDTYGWLYRPDAVASPTRQPPPSVTRPPATPPRAGAVDPSRAVDRRLTPGAPSRSPDSTRPAPRRTGRAVLVVLLVVLVLGVAAAAGMIWQA